MEVVSTAEMGCATNLQQASFYAKLRMGRRRQMGLTQQQQVGLNLDVAKATGPMNANVFIRFAAFG